MAPIERHHDRFRTPKAEGHDLDRHGGFPTRKSDGRFQPLNNGVGRSQLSFVQSFPPKDDLAVERVRTEVEKARRELQTL